MGLRARASRHAERRGREDPQGVFEGSNGRDCSLGRVRLAQKVPASARVTATQADSGGLAGPQVDDNRRLLSLDGSRTLGVNRLAPSPLPTQPMRAQTTRRLFGALDRETVRNGENRWEPGSTKRFVRQGLTIHSGKSQEPPTTNPLVAGSVRARRRIARSVPWPTAR
jgi:hypothetical protein